MPAPYAVVLGIAQDAGHPQAGCEKACCRDAWEQGGGHLVASLGIVDPDAGAFFVVDATPDFPRQLRTMQQGGGQLGGILLTHAHIGHYLGLVNLGREVMGTRQVPVHAMPRMRSFLTGNGPWSLLVELGNIELTDASPGTAVQLTERLRAVPFAVPHRDEFSETVGWRIEGPTTKVVWLPDIDKWERWSVPLEEMLAGVDVAWVDGTFYAGGEIARDMAEVPHPFVVETMARVAALPESERKKLRFVHLNHTNPALVPGSAAWKAIDAAGLAVAVEGERVGL